MAYTDDAVLAKLSALNESHDSIASTAQWIMFHRRHATQTVRLWLTKLKDLPSPKRLNMVYLANEVTQQTKARHKEDFVQAFSPVIADATALAYKGASSDIQTKLRRVVDVWRDRNIFERDIQDDMEARLNEIDRARNASKVGGFGGSMFGQTAAPAAIPTELGPLVTAHQTLSKSTSLMKNTAKNANAEYEKLTDPSNLPPAPPVYAARLNGLLKTLASQSGAVSECVKTRREIIHEMEKLLATHREALASEEAELEKSRARITEIESRKQEVELNIMGGLPTATEENTGSRPSGSPAPEPDRPQMEALTPPHVQNHDDIYDQSNEPHNGQLPMHSIPTGAGTGASAVSAPGIEMLSHLASQYESVPLNGNKKRKIEAADDFPDLGNDDGIDADVNEMLRKGRGTA